MKNNNIIVLWLEIWKTYNKAKLLQEGIFILIHLFASDILVMKKLEIEKTEPTLIISVFQLFY